MTDEKRRTVEEKQREEKQRAYAVAAWLDGVEHDEANEAVCAAVRARLVARAHLNTWPGVFDVFEVIYVDGEPHRVYLDDKVVRFCGNPIVRRILDASPYTLNDAVRDYGHLYSGRRNLRRLYIEIGYSLNGFLELAVNDTEHGKSVHLSLTPPEVK